MIIATWKRGFEGLHKGTDAQKVAEEIISIGDDATPQQIVERAAEQADTGGITLRTSADFNIRR